MQQDRFKKHIIFSLIIAFGFLLFQVIIFWNAFAKEKDSPGILPFIFLFLVFLSLGYGLNIVLKALDKNRLNELIAQEVVKERKKILEEFENKDDDIKVDSQEELIASKVKSVIPKGNFKNLNKLINSYIKNLAAELEMVQGISYIKEENKDEYIFLSGFAITDNENKFGFKAGETLCGQVTESMETVYITEIPEDYFIIESGLGKAKPNQLVIAPVISNNIVVCILEMSFFKTFDDTSKQILQKSLDEISDRITRTLMS